MKKLKLLLLSLFLISTAAICQVSQIKIVSFQVKNTLLSKVDEWSTIPAAIILTAQKSPTVQLKEPKLVIQIRSGGAIVCGNNQSSAQPMSAFDVKTFTTNDIISMLGNCAALKEGTYQICAQFFNLDRIAISNEVCKEFKVESPKLQEYGPPTLITPDDGKTFTEAELSRPLSFKWTPLVPKPQQPITYRLKVWQLMQGQNGTAAMRTNPPIVTKDVDNITQTVVTGIYTGPCRSPYLCDFVWQVQALNREGKPMGNNEGKSDVFMFGAQDAGTSKSISLVAPENNKSISQKDAQNPIKFRWTPIIPKPVGEITYRLKVWQLMQGQNSTQAMRTNKPIFEKDSADITEASVSGIYTGPCRPPYLCDYVWQVQALDRTGKPIGENEGKSEAWSYSVLTSDCNVSLKIDSIKCTKEKDQLGNPIYKAFMTLNNTGTNPLNLNNVLNITTNPYATPNTYTPKYVINTNAIAYTSTSLIPPIVNTSGPVSFSTDVSMPISATKLITRFTLYDNISIASCNPIDSLTLPLCICTDCKDALFTINNPTVSVTNATTGLYTATGSINITGITPIYAIEMQVQSYSYSATPASCTNGVSSIENSGVINLSGSTINGLPISMLNETVSGLPSTNNGVAKNIKLISTSPLPSTMPFNVVFGLPTPLAGLNNDCCKMKFNICLRVKIFYDKDKCNSCSFLYCFPQFTN
jgi:hypothetical protein